VRDFLGRRRFLAGTAGLLVLPRARAARGYPAAGRLRLAVFGTMYNAEHFLTAAPLYEADVAALADPDRRKIDGVLKRWEEAAAKAKDPEAAGRFRRWARGEGVKLYADVRRMIAESAGEIDAVVVSHYDHLHGVACGAALRAGKPVCSERPLGLVVADARRLRSLAAETGLPTTYRSPGTGSGAFRRALELVEEGGIGPVEEVHVWFRRGGPDRDAPPQGRQEVPAGLDWDLWLGPLPWRDYHPDWMSYAHWRETCNGGLGSFGPHTTVLPFLALGIRELWDAPGAAIRVRAECARLNRVSFPRWERVRWEIPARGRRPPLVLTWHHGPDFAPGTREQVREKLRAFGVTKPEEADALMGTAGSLLVGRDGALVGDDHSVRVTALPRDRFAGFETRPLRGRESKGIYRDWIDACRGATPPVLATFENGGRLSEMLMIGNIATLFPGETLAYDPAAGRFAGHPGAEAKLAFPYREGWRIG